MLSRSIFSLCVLCLVGCTTTGSYISRTSMPAKPENCDLKVFMPGEKIEKNFDIVGTFSVQEAGLSVGCGWDDTLQKNKAKACSSGADAIQFLSVDTPSIDSTCYRTKANFIHFNR
jgi:hypothetical protein